MPEIVPTEARLDSVEQFDRCLISHPSLTAVWTRLAPIIKHPGGVPLVMVIGPSGTGKTTLVRKVYKEVLNDADSAMKADPGHIPIVLIEASSPDSGSFDWRDFYERFLEAAHEPLIEKKQFVEFNSKHPEPRSTPRELRRSMEQCIRHRRIKIVLIDEGQHLTKILGARRLQDQMDAIKSLASLSGVQFILVGTNELFTLLNQNGQLARRTRCIYFPRYKPDIAADREGFRNVLAMFEKRLPLTADGLLLNNSEFVYEHCLGCIGTLKDWLKLSLRCAIDAGKSSLELKDLKETALSNDSLIQMLYEINECEARVESEKLKEDELRTMLKYQKPRVARVTAERAHINSRSVGERTLVRDPVGVET